MKRIVVIAFILILCIGMVGCFASNKPAKESSKQTEITTLATEAPTNAPVGTVATTLKTVATTKIPAEVTDYPCKAYVTESLNVRRTPNLDYDAIGGLDTGDEVTIVGKEGDFYKIEWNAMDGNYNEKYAYVSAQYVSMTKSTTIPTVATTAKAGQ